MGLSNAGPAGGQLAYWVKARREWWVAYGIQMVVRAFFALSYLKRIISRRHLQSQRECWLTKVRECLEQAWTGTAA